MKDNTFAFGMMTGTLKRGKKRREFQDAVDRLLTKFCGSDWEYNYEGDDGLWGDGI